MITVNNSGVLKKLGEVSANSGGVLKKLNTVQINDGGALKKVFESSKPISSYNVGSIIKGKVNGVVKDFIIVHKGRPSTLYDVSCDGIWVLMKDIYEERKWNNNINKYSSSLINSYLNDTFYYLLDTNTRNAVKSVKIPYRNAGLSGTVASGSSGLLCYVFLLAMKEVGYPQSSVYDGEVLSYFSGLPQTDSKRIAYYNGAATSWWTRTPVTSTTEDVVGIGVSGGIINPYCYNSRGVRPVLILSNTVKIDKNGYIVA